MLTAQDFDAFADKRGALCGTRGQPCPKQAGQGSDKAQSMQYSPFIPRKPKQPKLLAQQLAEERLREKASPMLKCFT